MTFLFSKKKISLAFFPYKLAWFMSALTFLSSPSAFSDQPDGLSPQTLKLPRGSVAPKGLG